MKFKALRYKTGFKEFVTIDNFGGTYVVFTHEHPNPQPTTASMEELKRYYAEYYPLPPEINLDDMELVEFEYFEVGTVGADIRNKLIPFKNLLALLENQKYDGYNDHKKKEIEKLIKSEIKICKKNIEYLSKLL